MGSPGYPPCGIPTHDTPEWAPQDYIAERYHLGDLVVPGLCKQMHRIGASRWAHLGPPCWMGSSRPTSLALGPFGLSLRAPVAH